MPRSSTVHTLLGNRNWSMVAARSGHSAAKATGCWRATRRPQCSTDIRLPMASFHVLADMHLYLSESGSCSVRTMSCRMCAWMTVGSVAVCW